MTEPEFINSAVVRAPERFVLKGGSWRMIDIGVRYGLFIHPRFGPVLIDTGYGPRATTGRQRSLMLRLYGAVLRPRLIATAQPVDALARRGFAAEEVRMIIVTHFHPDHIAGLRDFPKARFLINRTAWSQIRAMSRQGRIHRGIFPELLPDDFGERLLPLEDRAMRDLPFGLGKGHDVFGDGTCLSVDLPGHSPGHFGLVWPDLSPPLLYAVDATWLSAALADRLPAGIAHLVYDDENAMRRSARRVRGFAEAGGRVVLCHDRVPA